MGAGVASMGIHCMPGARWGPSLHEPMLRAQTGGVFCPFCRKLRFVVLFPQTDKSWDSILHLSQDCVVATARLPTPPQPHSPRPTARPGLQRAARPPIREGTKVKVTVLQPKNGDLAGAPGEVQGPGLVSYELVRGRGRRACPQLALPQGREGQGRGHRRCDQKGTGYAGFGERVGEHPGLQDRTHQSDAGRRSPAGPLPAALSPHPPSEGSDVPQNEHHLGPQSGLCLPGQKGRLHQSGSPKRQIHRLNSVSLGAYFTP